MSAAEGLRGALAAARAPVVNDDDLQTLLAAAEDLAFDLRNALAVAAKANDPDGLGPVAVEAIVAAEGLYAAAKALEGRFEAVKKAAKAGAGALREALAADMEATGRKRVEGSTHAATPEAGSWRVVVTDEDALPPSMTRTTVKPDLSAIGKALAADEAVAGAARERGPGGVRITALSETTSKQATAR